MRVVIIKAGEPVPAPGRAARLGRSGLLAQALAARGHEVDWVVSAFDHTAKIQVYPADTSVTIGPGVTMSVLWAPSYRSHRSVLRLLHHAVLNRKLRSWLRVTPKPDVIVVALPIPELAATAVDFGRRCGVPVLVDCRDQWPELFLEGRGAALRFVLSVLTWPMWRATRLACQGATGITGHTQAFVQWGVRRAGRELSKTDATFPLAYPDAVPTVEQRREAEAVLDSVGVSHDHAHLRLVFVGTITQHFAFEPVVRAMRRLKQQGVAVEIVVCGDGDRLAALRRLADALPELRFLGWQPGHVIWELLRRSDCGFAPYAESRSFEESIPNKIIEYLSAGLPVVTSLSGLVRGLVGNEGLGWWYPSTDEDALADLLHRLTRDRASIGVAARNAARIFAAQYRAKDVYDRFAAHVEYIANGNTPGAIAPEARMASGLWE